MTHDLKGKLARIIREVVPVGRKNEPPADSAAVRNPEKASLQLVGTHHKTGTVWIRDVFRQICEHRGTPFFSGRQRDAPASCAVMFQDHSEFDLAALAVPFRGLHMIRDPRDVIISAAFYHRHAAEKWLRRRQWGFGLKSYQEAINACPTEERALLFEMENAAGKAIREMLDWDYTNPRFFEVRYEDLIQDESLEIFRRIFIFLGYEEAELPSLLEIARKNSLFSGHRNPHHVRSGKVAQWKQHFTPALSSRFVELFGDALERLGYEAEGSKWMSVSGPQSAFNRNDAGEQSGGGRG